MHFKLDENLPADAAEFLRISGDEASNVLEQGLRGHSDFKIAERCRRDRQVIVTFDLDFADVRVYPPAMFSGIIVLRLKRKGHDVVIRLFERILDSLIRYTLEGRLWIVDERRIRVRE